jgi:hypothetical protein
VSSLWSSRILIIVPLRLNMPELREFSLKIPDLMKRFEMDYVLICRLIVIL